MEESICPFQKIRFTSRESRPKSWQDANNYVALFRYELYTEKYYLSKIGAKPSTTLVR
jgi:hypothetical protein